jgi:hypothetical protein
MPIVYKQAKSVRLYLTHIGNHSEREFELKYA